MLHNSVVAKMVFQRTSITHTTTANGWQTSGKKQFEPNRKIQVCIHTRLQTEIDWHYILFVFKSWKTWILRLVFIKILHKLFLLHNETNFDHDIESTENLTFQCASSVHLGNTEDQASSWFVEAANAVVCVSKNKNKINKKFNREQCLALTNNCFEENGSPVNDMHTLSITNTLIMMLC